MRSPVKAFPRNLRNSPDGPKNENFQRPPLDIEMPFMFSLGVGKRQSDEVSSKTAPIGSLKARSKMLKASSPGFKRNSPNIICLSLRKNLNGSKMKASALELRNKC